MPEKGMMRDFLLARREHNSLLPIYLYICNHVSYPQNTPTLEIEISQGRDDNPVTFLQFYPNIHSLKSQS
jgi:hypothetical protein